MPFILIVTLRLRRDVDWDIISIYVSLFYHVYVLKEIFLIKNIHEMVFCSLGLRYGFLSISTYLSV